MSFHSKPRLCVVQFFFPLRLTPSLTGSLLAARSLPHGLRTVARSKRTAGGHWQIVWASQPDRFLPGRPEASRPEPVPEPERASLAGQIG